MAKNHTELGKKLPALKSIVGPKALLKDLYFTLKTFSYLPNVSKRHSYDPYLESKESLNGDHSEAVDILASQDISLGQLTDVYMASKLLGYEGHEKLLEILGLINVGVPDALNFATDLTAFFEENCKTDILSEKAKANMDLGRILQSAEYYLVKSGLFYYPQQTNHKEPVENGYTKTNGATEKPSKKKPVHSEQRVNGNHDPDHDQFGSGSRLFENRCYREEFGYFEQRS